MDRVIVYGMGKAFESIRKWLECNCDIIGYSDRQRKVVDGGVYFQPETLKNLEFDYIFVTSIKYYNEIKKDLIETYHIQEDKIVNFYLYFGDFRNDEVRDQWVMEKLSVIPSGKIILDAGAGEKKYEPYCRHLKYIAQDFGKYEPNQVKCGLQFDKWDTSKNDILCDIIDMPLENESIDVILCTEVFEHLKNPVLALKEFSRVLKQGGQLILTAPFCSLTHMAPYYFSNGFSEYWYREHLNDYGFKIIEMTRNGNYFKYLGQELRRIPEISDRYCNYELDNDEISAIVKTIKLMSQLSEKDDNKSSELLCFGYMLVATKIKQ